MSRKGSPWFTDRMCNALATMTSEHLPDQTPDDLLPSVICAMFLQSIIWWLEHERPIPPEQLAEQSSQLVRAVLRATAAT